MQVFRLCLPLFFLFTVIYAQNDSRSSDKIVEILNADRSNGIVEDGQRVQRLIGRVALAHDGAKLFCDSAWVYELNNFVRAYGQIHMIQGDTLSIYGDSLVYNGAKKTAQLNGRVRLLDTQMQMYTSELHYDRNKNIASYSKPAEINNGVDRIRSKRGDYHSVRREFTFLDSVVIINPEYRLESDFLVYESDTKITRFYGPTYIYSEGSTIYCEHGWHDPVKDEAQFSKSARISNGLRLLHADSIYYRRSEGYGLATGNVSIRDSVENMLILSGWAETWKNLNLFLATDSAQMIQFFESDTLYLHADTLKGIENEGGGRSMSAWFGVKFYKNDLQGACDSLFYADSDSLMSLFGSPFLWSDSSQMSGNTIFLKLFKGIMYQYTLDDRAIIISKEDTLRYNQIGSKVIYGFFEENALRYLLGYEQGEVVYYPKDNEGHLIGMNVLTCKSLRIQIESNQVERLTCKDKPVGTLYPWEIADDVGKRLTHFNWDEGDRPFSRFDIFKKRMR
jgi:lipopolysaccharide export system protein LptA